MKIILQKYIANSGACSRRQAEKLIKESFFWNGPKDNMPVLVNGQRPEIGMTVMENDEVFVFGEKIELAKEKIYIILNKPIGYTCTSRDFKEERNVFELLTKENYQGEGDGEAGDYNLHIVGRLDKNSRGLTLLTNDGNLTQRITHPSFEHRKEYEVELCNPEIKNNSDQSDMIIKKMKAGIDIGEGNGIVCVSDISFLGKNRFRIELREGKKRQLRRMFRAIGSEVCDIRRVMIGGLGLGNLEEGKWRRLGEEEVGLVFNEF